LVEKSQSVGLGMTKLRLIILILAGATFALPRNAAAEWPERPVHFIVPFPAGGASDVATRIVANYVSRALGRQIVVENKSGANGNIGIEYAAKSTPDGYTVLVASQELSSNPHVYKMTVDPLKALIPVVQISRQPIVLAAHPSLGVATLSELTALARQQPGLPFGTGSGVGSSQAMMALWYAKLAGITLKQVPYRGGAPAINDLIAGHVKLGSLGSTPLIPHYQAGTLKLLAQSTATRAPSLPKVPTFREEGFTELVLDQWIGVFVPAGTPAAIAARLNAEVNAALRDEGVRKSLADQGQEPVGGTAEAYTGFVREEWEKFGRLVKDLNITIE
jgi:tripartite-type tricarboxylate transporter receptor subunit TctC